MKKEERKRVTKRILAVLMAVLMVLPGNLDGILADDNNSTKAGLPSITAYAAKEQLMNSFTPDSNGTAVNIGKLIFGKNSDGDAQEWYILGKDSGVSGDNTVIFASSPIIKSDRYLVMILQIIQRHTIMKQGQVTETVLALFR